MARFAGANGITVRRFRPFRYKWQDAPDQRDSFDILTDAGERGWSEPECHVSRYSPGRPMTADEFEKFQLNGGKISYCEARAAQQQQLDLRHEDRRGRSKIVDLVIDVVAVWDSKDYIAKHRNIVHGILGLPRNARRRNLTGLSTKERRHQQAIRLLSAVAIEGLSQAEYCRRHRIHKSDASRMLAHLCDKEPALRNAINAISACTTMTSWQNRQQQQMLCNRERAVRLVYGWDYQDVADNGWLTDFSAGSIRSINGHRFKPIELLRDEPFTPFELHLPQTWQKIMPDACPPWDALGNPSRAIKRWEPAPDRFRHIKRAVRLHGGRRSTWDIARALDRNAKPIVYWDRHAWPETAGLDPIIWRELDDPGLSEDERRQILGLMPVKKPSKAKAERPTMVHRISSRKVCICVPRVKYPPPVRKPHGIIPPFARRDWITWPVKETESAPPIIKRTDTGAPVYLVRPSDEI
jgi:hypothetical protein